MQIITISNRKYLRKLADLTQKSYCKGCAFKHGNSACTHPKYILGHTDMGCEINNIDYIFVEIPIKDKIREICK